MCCKVQISLNSSSQRIHDCSIMGGGAFLLSNVLNTKGGGWDPPLTVGTFFEFWGTKTRLLVRYKVKININSSSQCIL